MRSMSNLVFLGLLSLICSPTNCQDVSKEETLEVTERGGYYVLNVPVSELEMAIPKGHFLRHQNPPGQGGGSPRHFYFRDDDRVLIISGWFEPAEGFKGIKQLWESDSAEWKRNGLPAPEDVSFVEIDKWSVVFYDYQHAGMRSSHLRAEWVQAGTWIDVHISITGTLSEADERAKLRDVLDTIRVREKSLETAVAPLSSEREINSGVEATGGNQQHAYAVPGHGKLSLFVPAQWRDTSKPLEDPPSVLLRFRPLTGDAFYVQITAMWLDPEKSAQLTPDSLKASVVKSSVKPLKGAVEKELKLQDLRGEQTIGYYYSLTDRNPPPQEYKYLTQGITRTGEMMVVFTILHRGENIPEKATALQMLANATYSK